MLWSFTSICLLFILISLGCLPFDYFIFDLFKNSHLLKCIWMSHQLCVFISIVFTFLCKKADWTTSNIKAYSTGWNDFLFQSLLWKIDFYVLWKLSRGGGKVLVFLLHFLVHCNTCQTKIRGLKSCGIHPRLKHLSPVSCTIIHMLDCLPVYSNTGQVLRFVPISTFIMALIWVLGYLN